jgi:hypothetical protein
MRGKVKSTHLKPLLLLFAISLALTLLTIVDIRRAALGLEYVFKSPWASLSPLHLLGLTLGVIGMAVSYRAIQLAERRVNDPHLLGRATRGLVFAVGGLLVIDLVFLYRGVAASRIMAAGLMNISGVGIPATTTIGLVVEQTLNPLLRPAAAALNYLAAVWHAVFLGLLLASLFITALAGYVGSIWSTGGRLRTTLLGTVLALPQPFCSCCASPIAASLYRRGAPLSSALAFLVASPMLNITTLILATLLPPGYAALRIGAGLILAVPVSYAVSGFLERAVVIDRESEHSKGRLYYWLTLLLNRYCNLFHFEQLSLEQATRTPTGFVRAWLKTSWRIARVVLPIFVVGALATAYAASLLRPATGNTPLGVLASSIIGTLLMIATWTELPVAGVLIGAGLTGPAASFLVTLPAVSVPCLLIFGGALGSLRAAALLGVAVFLLGLLSGLLFL